MKSKRFGKFEVALSLIDNDPQMVKQLMSKVIIIRAENILNRIEYTALSEYFDEVIVGSIVPFYTVQCVRSKDNIIKFTFHKEVEK